MNIVLIGMPGCGKSTVGVVLAKAMGYRFMDSDLVIQEKTEKLLSELIDEYGEDGFIKIENDVNKSIVTDKTVIATGGSAVYGQEAMEALKKNSIFVYLEVENTELDDRVTNLKDRGVITHGKNTMAEIFAERCSLYEKYADITIHESESCMHSVSSVVRRIISDVENRVSL